MAIKVIQATKNVIDALKKAHALTPTSTIVDQPKNENTPVIKIDGSLTGGGQLVPAKVVSGNGLIGYTCDIYKNGLSEPPTETGTVFLANGGSTIFVLPVGTILFVQKYPIPIHGSTNS